MVLDAEYLTRALLDGAEEGVRQGLEQIKSRAQKHAPVRDIFKHGRGKLHTAEYRGTASGGVQSVRSISRGPEVMSARAAQQSGFYTVGTLATRKGRSLTELTAFGRFSEQQQARWDEKGGSQISRGKAKYTVGGKTMTGRANSYAPVVASPAGMIGGANFRHWAGENTLAVGVIRNPSGGRFELASLLSSRGRYEAFGRAGADGKRSGKGRGVRMGPGGQMMVGGTLHDGITVDGPHRNGAEVYGFVQAVANDPGRKHNYAADQEFGSRHNKAQPFLRPGLRESKERITKLIDPSKGRRGTLQRAIQSGSRPQGSETNVGVVVDMKVRIDFSGIHRDFAGGLVRGFRGAK